MARVKVEISGTSPLLMNRLTDENEVSISNGHRPIFLGEQDVPREQAKKTAYIDDNGILYIPGPNIFASIIDAGSFVRERKVKLTTQKRSLIPSIIQVEELICSLHTDKFEVDSRRVVIPSTGGAVMRHRARIDNWKISFTILIDDEISSKLAQELIDIAGKKVGIGDYRPFRRGPFGRFVVTNWKKLNN
jgi:hypothetical protein